MPPTQTTRTNHLGYDAGASRKIPDGAVTPNALTRVALTLFRLLCFGFGVVKAALKAIADWLTTRPADRGGAPPAFQLQVKVGKHHFKRGLRDQSCRCEYRAGCRDGQHRIGAVNHDIPGRDGDMQRRQAHLQPDISNGQ